MPPISAEAERRIMSKKVSEAEHNYNTDFDKLLNDMDHGRVNPKLSSFYTRPAYYGTKQCAKHPAAVPACNDCPYYLTSRGNSKRKCRFPWDDPRDWDMVIFKNLPCQK